jgi:thiamine kinase-like enzyme
VNLMIEPVEWIRTHFNTSNFTLTPLNKGLTNHNVLVTIQDERFIVRFPKTDTAHIVNRDHEARALSLISKTGLDVQTLYFDPRSGIKVTRYVPDLMTFDAYAHPDRIERTATLMRRLHALKTPIGALFDPIARYHQYRAHVIEPLISDEAAQAVIDGIHPLCTQLTLCHNDWVPGNIGFSPQRDYLLDYEYAGDNDPFFDVMSFITENEITPEERERFLLAYFGRQPDADEQVRLRLYEDFHNLLWCTWAQMMWESRHELIYQSIAHDKFTAFLKSKK